MSQEIVDVFENLSDQIQIVQQSNDVLELVDADYYNPEPIDLEAFQELLLDDFGSHVSMFITPYMEGDFELGSYLNAMLPRLPLGVYYLEDMISYAIVKDMASLKNMIKKYIESKVNSDVIHTVRQFIEHNMNSSLSAKKLFMHRNTLNYRIENFIEATHINVKTFKGANCIYMLYTF